MTILIVATHGRSFWILDDIASLRQMIADSREIGAHLFKPAPPIACAATPTPIRRFLLTNLQARILQAGAIIDYSLSATIFRPGDARNPGRTGQAGSPLFEQRSAGTPRG